MKKIGWIAVIVFALAIGFIANNLAVKKDVTVKEQNLVLAQLIMSLFGGFILGCFLALYGKLCDIAEKSEKKLTMYTFEVVKGGVLFIIATNREEAIEEAKAQHKASRISYISEHPIDKIPFFIYR